MPPNTPYSFKDLTVSMSKTHQTSVPRKKRQDLPISTREQFYLPPITHSIQNTPIKNDPSTHPNLLLVPILSSPFPFLALVSQPQPNASGEKHPTYWLLIEIFSSLTPHVRSLQNPQFISIRVLQIFISYSISGRTNRPFRQSIYS